MSDRTDKRVTTLEEAIESGWSACRDTAKSVKHRESMRLEWQAYTVALASLAADAAETQTLREENKRLHAALKGQPWAWADLHGEAVEQRDAAVADCDRLAEAAHDLNEYASNKAGYWQHPLTEKARAHFAALAGREGSDDACKHTNWRVEFRDPVRGQINPDPRTYGQWVVCMDCGFEREGSDDA